MHDCAESPPAGDIRDPNAKLFPFKIHTASSRYDATYNYLLQPVTAGEGGFWSSFDWNVAFQLSEQYTGLPYSGAYDFR